MTTHLSDGRELLPSTPDTVALMAFPAGPSSSHPLLPAAEQGLMGKLARVAEYRRNPRSPEYMRHVAASILPQATVIEAQSATAPAAIAGARHIVLLWPDAIGYGWTPLERNVFSRKRRDAQVYALTGRRRGFKLTPATLFSLRLRRVAERLWLGEAVMAVGLLVSAPFLVMWDLARGHR